MIVDYNDYINILKDEFPELSEKSIKDILKHGFKNYIRYNATGADVLIRDTKVNKIVAYCGEFRKNLLNMMKYNNKKWHIKEKLLYDMQNTLYDGFYYFGLDEKDGGEFIKKLKRKGDFITIYKTHFRQSLQDLYHDGFLKYIFKLNYPLDVGFSFYKDEFKVLKKDVEFLKCN